MRIRNFEKEPVATIPFLNAGRRPRDYRTELLPIHFADVDGLPETLDGMVVCADLQGRETFASSGGRMPRLLGEVIPGQLAELCENHGHHPKRIGAVLAGDFYTVPALDRRGGSGDVTEVWRCFADEFAFVVGVAGNHDEFADSDRSGAPRFASPLHFLDGQVIRVHGMSIGGVSGIIGNVRRPWRRTEEDYSEAFVEVAAQQPQLIVMHDGPDDPVGRQRGHAPIRQWMEQMPKTLIVRGHCHWTRPFVEYASGHQVLNVDSRVVVLSRAERRP
ncbi:MAG: metallophosphoesterase [Planctomycetota bacterium]